MRFHSRLGLGLWFLAIAGAPTLLGAQSPTAPSLGTADSFAVLGGSSVTSTESTVVTGNLGVSPGNTISSSITVKVGATYRNDSVARQAQHDATSAYNDLAARTCTTTLTTPIGGMTLGPGVYCLSSPTQLTGPLILDAANDPNAVWIFKIGSTLTTAAGSSVRVINNGYEGNIFWQVSDSATLNAGTTFVGNVLTHNDITLHAGASISGRLLAQGAVFLDGNNVTLCCGPIIVSPETLPDGRVCATYPTTTFTAGGGMAPYTFSVASDNVVYGPLPDGLTLTDGVLSGTPTRQGSFKILITATDSKGCTGARSYVIDIGCPDDPPIALPAATACVDYNCHQIAPSCGNGPHVFSVTGVLPDGLVLSPDGMLCGTPTTPGDYAFDITDSASGCPRHFTLQVICNIMISPATLPSATCSTPYCEILTASCGTPPYTFSAPQSTLPDGLIVYADGKVCGTPTTPGPSTFIVTVTDAKSCTTSQPYTVIVKSQLTILPPTPPDGVVCEPYVPHPITASCGTPPYACKVVAGALPPGLMLGNCLISGTPTKAGSFSFTIKVTDSQGFTTRPYTIVITCPKITIAPPVLPPVTACQQPGAAGAPSLCVKLTPSCAIGTTVFSVTAGALPPGIFLSDDGTLCGTPSAAGDYSWTVKFVDSISGCTGSAPYRLIVPGGLTITPACPPQGTPGVFYSEIFTASGGTPPYMFNFIGTLPPGLMFMPATPTPTTATISGMPMMPGCFPFTITVTDANGCSTSSASHEGKPHVVPLFGTPGLCTSQICIVAGGPTLTGWGMVVLSVLLVGVGFLMISKGGFHV
jgi:large repetitive protein